jgi:hypothetical protein
MIGKPLIVAIDDEENTVRPLVPDECDLQVVVPERVSAEEIDFERASLILLDHEISANPNVLSLEVHDGAGFVAPLRSWARRNKVHLPPIVILTNRPEAFAEEVPTVGAALPLGNFRQREHRIAPVLDVEWLLSKDDDEVATKISALVRGYEEIRAKTNFDGVSLEDIAQCLSLPQGASWHLAALDDLRRSRPPITERTADDTEPFRGPSQVVRWICHHVLPYPGLLLSDRYAAWALGTSVSSMAGIVGAAGQTDWITTARSAIYTGALSGLVSRRWWRAGIDQLGAMLDDKAAERGDLAKVWAEIAPGLAIEPQAPSSSRVVVWSPDFLETDIIPMTDAVQLHPPGWPAEAMEPWMRRDDVRADPVLEAMIDPLDR